MNTITRRTTVVIPLVNERSFYELYGVKCIFFSIRLLINYYYMVADTR